MRPPITRTRCSVATKRVMASVELVRYICEHSCHAQNYRNALISKTWSNEALSIIWDELDSMLPLLQLLGPMTLREVSLGQFHFSYDRYIQPDDWAVFRRYSWRVHEIHHMEHKFDFSESVFIDIVSTSMLSGHDLVPHLGSLTHQGRGALLKYVPLFIHKALESLALHILDETAPDAELEFLLKRALIHISHKSPMLQCLSLTSYHRVRVSAELDVALAALSRLEELWISPSLLVSSTLDVIAHLPHLEIWSVYGEHTAIGPDFITSPSADAFPSLTTFASVSLRFSSILSIFKAANPRHLRKLDVETCCKESPQAWYRLIATVTSICPTIQVINVHGVCSNDGDPEQSPFSPFVSPTRYCSSLTSLRLSPAPRLHLTVETMRGLLTCLPALETLELDESQEAPTLPLFALSELAPLCPRMKSLTLYMDTKRLRTTTPPRTRFLCLDVLNVGYSPLKSSHLGVAIFLATILPDPCILRCKPSSGNAYDNKRCTKWKPVVDFLPFMLKLRTATERDGDAPTTE